MHIAPDKIRDVMVALDEGLHVSLPLDALLGRVLPKVAACVPDAQAVRVYRVLGQRGKLEAATDSPAPHKELGKAEREALETGAPVRDQSRWVAPLLHDAWVFGWLEMDVEQADFLPMLTLLTYTLTRAIEQVESSSFTADNLVLSSRLITTADNYSDMAQAAVYTIARSMTGVAITLFDQPLEETAQPTSRAVYALGAAEGPLDLTDITYSQDLPNDEQFKNLWRGLPVIEQDFSTSGLALTVRHFPQTQWLAAFGLRAGDRVLGTLEILNAEPYQLLPEEIDAYTTLADQMGVAVRNRQLLHQTSNALDEVRTLYEINRAMIAAQDRLDVLRALYSLSPDALNITHVAVQHNESNEISDLVVSHRLAPNSEQVLYQSLREIGGDEMVLFARRYWQGKGQPVVFVEDVNALNVGAPPELLRMAKAEGIESAIIIYIYERERLRDIIRVGFAQARRFDAGAHRLYEALADQIAVVFQNQRLLQETQISTVELSSQVRVLQTLNALAATIATTRDEKKLLEETARALAIALSVDAAHILLLAPSHQTLVIAGEYPLENGIGYEFDVEAIPFFGDALATNSTEPILVEDIETDSRLTAAQRELYRSIGIRSIISVPLFIQGELVGAVGLEIRQAGKHFPPQAVVIGRAITGQVAITLQNIRLLNNAQRQAEQLQRSSSFSQQLQATLDLRATLEMALAQGRQIVEFDYMAIALALHEDGLLRSAATYFNGESAVTSHAGSPVTVENTVMGRVWQTQEFVHIPNTQGEGQQYARVSLPSELRSLLVTPIFSRGNCLGVVLIGSVQPYAYSDVDEVVFGHMASQVAVAIDNSTVYDQSRRIAASESLVNDISARLQQQVDIPSLMNVAANELGRALGARRARVRLGTLPGDESGVK